jgi:hypothetical protein
MPKTKRKLNTGKHRRPGLQQTTPAKPAPKMVKCRDCGFEYEAGAPHEMFCEVKTCTECGTTYTFVIEENEYGKRVCPTCKDQAEGSDDCDDYGEHDESEELGEDS